MSMFCYQCEQRAKGGCKVQGVCGKSSEVAALQDLLMYQLKAIGFLAYGAEKSGKRDAEIDRFLIEGLFTTVTNVDFDPERLSTIITSADEFVQKAKELYLEAGHGLNNVPSAIAFKPARTLHERIIQGQDLGIMSDPALNEDIRSLRDRIRQSYPGYTAEPTT